MSYQPWDVAPRAPFPSRAPPTATARFEGQSEAKGQFVPKDIEKRQPKPAPELPASLPFEGVHRHSDRASVVIACPTVCGCAGVAS